MVVASTLTIMAIGVAIPFIPALADALQMRRPENSFMGFLALELAFYAVEVQLLKWLYIRCFGKWL